MPELGASTLALFRCGYGLLLLAFLVHALPEARRFFVSERWGGYSESSPVVDAVQNPAVMPVVLGAWLACAGLLIVGRWSLVAAVVNVALCRYFFVSMRWRSAARGLGAPGFMTYWLATAVLLLELCGRRGDESLLSLAVLALQLDFAFLYLSSGIYKATAGYARGAGMDLGMVNPQWGRWWRSLRELPPSSPLFRVSNQAAWSLEILAAILMMIPATRPWGGLLLVASFAYVAFFIRLGTLAPMVMLVGVLFLDAGSATGAYVERLLRGLPMALTTPAPSLAALPRWLDATLGAGLWTYLALLPLAYAGLFYNLYGNRRLGGGLQRILDAYTNLFGLVVWRVFSVDLIDFFIRIYRCRPDGEAGDEITRFGWRSGSLRFGHVAESITLTCIFTALKYYPSRPELFRDRIVRYTRSLPLARGEIALFRYLIIDKRDDRFTSRALAELRVDPVAGTVGETTLDPGRSIRSPAAVSPVHEAAKPGSYAPAGS